MPRAVSSHFFLHISGITFDWAHWGGNIKNILLNVCIRSVSGRLIFHPVFYTLIIKT